VKRTTRQRDRHEAPHRSIGGLPWWLAQDGQRAKMLVDRACRVCGGPASNFHHAPPRSLGGINVADAGGPVCGSGTTGCHGELEEGDAVARVAYGQNMTSDEIAYVLWLFGEARGRQYLEDEYGVAVPPLHAVWRGAAHYRRPRVVYDG
jgi:hypothetical protein